MSTIAAVMSGKGSGAIATVALYGCNARQTLTEIFKPKDGRNISFDTGKIILGDISGENGFVDEVLLGCEGENYYAINCHGNPLIVSDIMKLLQKHGARPVTAEKLLTETQKRTGKQNTIALEAKIATIKAKTLKATKIISRQQNKGLAQTAAGWLENTADLNLKEIQQQVKDILEHSANLEPLLFGAKIVLAGPPNSGKSTLLNQLAGKEKAIVSDIRGTTRDWITADCLLGEVFAEVIDTAGLTEILLSDMDETDKAAQERAKELLEDADLILLVLDASIEEVDNLKQFSKTLSGKKTLTVLNKTDLPGRFDISQLPENLRNTVRISAKTGAGCDVLILTIEQLFGASNVNGESSVCFTERQKGLLGEIIAAETSKQAISAITELLNGELRV